MNTLPSGGGIGLSPAPPPEMSPFGPGRRGLNPGACGGAPSERVRERLGDAPTCPGVASRFEGIRPSAAFAFGETEEICRLGCWSRRADGGRGGGSTNQLLSLPLPIDATVPRRFAAAVPSHTHHGQVFGSPRRHAATAVPYAVLDRPEAAAGNPHWVDGPWTGDQGVGKAAGCSGGSS
ncbi:hypothetical protein BGZ61DRAFT_554113 [Ilyonectria robusta]|uniref:uncharacterized protein n=1 Tax=Ilyonectria robusta TaxID=1079257 RepID=UPI001E8D80D6|nr:uncharacterized protein BGZ61DRAFT_554113 [Ilyonectria robusta]KAH8736272.1 hypothetical protein BGZ61DRAFT_554113 [Ilyonectria robusta]